MTKLGAFPVFFGWQWRSSLKEPKRLKLTRNVPMMSECFRVSIAKAGRIFWSSQWVSKERAEDIRRKNQRLVDEHGWNHVVTTEAAE